MRHGFKSWGILAGLAMIAAVGSAARASFLDGDPNAIPGFTGTQAFTDSGDGETFTANVDFAVFAPGTFPGSGPITGSYTLSGSDYVYAYLVTVDSSSSPNEYISSLTVGVESGSGAIEPGTNNSLGGTPPLFQQIGSSFLNYWTGIPTNSSSDIVLFVSPNAPIYVPASVTDGFGLSDQQSLPSPAVPEPASFGLIVLSSLFVLGRRNRGESLHGA
jgi:hypothetical protein